jgi:hypothetical protein
MAIRRILSTRSGAGLAEIFVALAIGGLIGGLVIQGLRWDTQTQAPSRQARKAAALADMVCARYDLFRYAGVCARF